MKDTLNAINETLKYLSSNFLCFHVDRGREVNVVESLLFVENTLKAIDDKIGDLECIDRKLCAIWTQLNRIADSLENHGTLTLELKSDPSDGPFTSQGPKEPEGFADME